MYTQYVKNYGRARSELAAARKNSLEFNSYITVTLLIFSEQRSHDLAYHEQELEKSNAALLANKDIFAYMIMPVQRIPRYQLLLRDLLKHTDKDHVDYESLQKVDRPVILLIGGINTYLFWKTGLRSNSGSCILH